MTKKLSRVVKLKNILLATLLLTVAASMPAVITGAASAWGPERQTYTNNEPADHVTFNSITDNVAVGDERNFVRVTELGESGKNYVDTLTVEPGKEYEVYIYYHNNAASNLNESGVGIANGVRVVSAFPTILKKGESGMISGLIYTTNGDPETVWDEAYINTDYDEVALRYKTGTAIIHNDGGVNGSVLATDLFTENGAYIGINTLDGRIPGCAEYSGYITYTLVAEKVENTLTKQVSTDGENWQDEVTVSPGDYVTYKVVFKNTGNTNFTNAIFKDTHDDGLSLRTGSTKVYTVDSTDGETIDDIIDISGYNVGDVAAGALIQIIYQAQVADNAELCSSTLNNTISVRYNSEDQGNDSASVRVSCGEDEPLPDEIVSTGPVEIIMAIVVVLGICGGAFYLYRTRRTLKTVENEVSGAEPKDSKSTTATPASSEKSSETGNAKDLNGEGTKES